MHIICVLKHAIIHLIPAFAIVTDQGFCKFKQTFTRFVIVAVVCTRWCLGLWLMPVMPDQVEQCLRQLGMMGKLFGTVLKMV